MAKTTSNITAGLARFVKVAMVAVLTPLTVGLLQGILGQLEVLSASGATFREWVEGGVATYVGLHMLLYRPVSMFRVSHRIFSVLASWLFGGQVASVDATAGSAGGGKGKGKRAKREGATQGSTLVAFSPYVIPLYTILVAAAGLLLRQWLDRSLVDGPLSFLIGVTIAFHWLMTADELQQQRGRWHVETYLLALGLVFVVTLLLGGACLPWAVPEFSFAPALADGLSRTHAIYTTLIQRLFF
jgi:hypothetical protein